VREFVAAVFQQHGLSPPTEGQIQTLAMLFSTNSGDSCRIEARDCLCLVDALFRATFQPKNAPNMLRESPPASSPKSGGSAQAPAGAPSASPSGTAADTSDVSITQDASQTDEAASQAPPSLVRQGSVVSALGQASGISNSDTGDMVSASVAGQAPASHQLEAELLALRKELAQRDNIIRELEFKLESVPPMHLHAVGSGSAAAPSFLPTVPSDLPTAVIHKGGRATPSVESYALPHSPSSSSIHHPTAQTPSRPAKPWIAAPLQFTPNASVQAPAGEATPQGSPGQCTIAGGMPHAGGVVRIPPHMAQARPVVRQARAFSGSFPSSGVASVTVPSQPITRPPPANVVEVSRGSLKCAAPPLEGGARCARSASPPHTSTNGVRAF